MSTVADGTGVPRMAVGCAFVALGAIAVIAWLATFAALSSASLGVGMGWLAVAIGTTWVAYRLSRKLWPEAISEPISASSESTRSDRYSWRKPGRWRLAYAIPWLAIAVLYVVTFGGRMTLQDYVQAIPLILIPAFFPAASFLLIRPKGWLWVVALLGLPIAAWLALLVGFVNWSDSGSSPLSQLGQVAWWGLLIAVFAALIASLIAVVVLPRPKWVDDAMGGLSG